MTTSKSPADDWRYIPGYPLYMINGEWEVRNIKSGATMKPSTDGTWTVYLYDEHGVQKHRGVRRLYRLAFEEK